MDYNPHNNDANNRALIEELAAQLNTARAEAINNGVQARLGRSRVLELEALLEKTGAPEAEGDEPTRVEADTATAYCLPLNWPSERSAGV